MGLEWKRVTLAILLVCGFLQTCPVARGEQVEFKNATVHDPSVIKVGQTYYVFGSHMGAAKTTDLMNWTQISTDAGAGNTLVPDVKRELQEALEWAGVDTFWAPDVIQLKDGKFYMYYCAARIDAPRSALGIAVAQKVEGPYKNLGVFLKSGMWGKPGVDGKVYDPTIHPNAVDPDVFYDKTGKLWMVYGSYSGGIFVLQLDPKTGFPLNRKSYGKRLIGGNHSRIEAPYVLYSPESDYYYLFVSFGGFTATGGYHIRVARSRHPDGPYLDAQGTDMASVAGAKGSFFDDKAIAPHGVKLMGGYQFAPDQPGELSRGYLSPGHNSAYFDDATKKYFLFFHTRFVGRGEEHEVRVHQMFLNKDGWLVVAPHRYTEETIGNYDAKEIAGDYKLLNHGKDFSPDAKQSVAIMLGDNGSVSGAASGTWKLTDNNYLELTLDGATYRGRILQQWDDDAKRKVLAFSALSADGTAVWGSKGR